MRSHLCRASAKNKCGVSLPMVGSLRRGSTHDSCAARIYWHKEDQFVLINCFNVESKLILSNKCKALSNVALLLAYSYFLVRRIQTKS